MNGKVLLDTNIIIALFEAEASIINGLKISSEVFLSSIVLGELYYGIFKSANVEQNISRIEELRKRLTVLSCDSNTSEVYGKIKNNLREKGRPIPENDIWISALSKQYNLTLITRDKHFEEVEDILIERW
jgi:tRNA(fMet)-specific endonuclease VapC